MGLKPNDPPNPVWKATQITKPHEIAEIAATMVMTGTPSSFGLAHPGACACICGRHGTTAAEIDTMMKATPITAITFSR